jgi:hypothetical protein
MKRHTLYKTIFLITVISILTLSLAGCSMVGLEFEEYSSVFVDAQNEDGNISFKLNLSPDRTFTLTRYDGDEKAFTYEGYSRTSTVRGRTEMLCTVTSAAEDCYYPYFTARYLDDGSLAAFAEGETSIFGSGLNRDITLVIFK